MAPHLLIAPDEFAPGIHSCVKRNGLNYGAGCCTHVIDFLDDAA
jgi:hypothetical protein